MNLSDKLIALRKSRGLSQETLAEQLNVSRQAISRWESGSAMPDAANILQLSKLFDVTADYLLNDAYQSDRDLPKLKEVNANHLNQILFYLVMLEVMILLIQFMTTVLLKNAFFAGLSVLLFAAPVAGFEYAHRKSGRGENDASMRFRKRFYKISAWLGTYFPIRFLAVMVMQLWLRPYSAPAFECAVLGVYIAAALILNLTVDQHYLRYERDN